MRNLLFIFSFVCSFNALGANFLKVAVIDTGLDLKYSQFANLCPNGHKDFTGEGLTDVHGHGTNIVGLIVNTAKTKNYCIVLIKAYSFKNKQKEYITEALIYADSINANIINLSGGGTNPITAERQIIMKLLEKKITIVVAAGNNGQNLDKACNYYPACYDKRIYVIGSFSDFSNYGPIVVDTIYDGHKKSAFGQTMSGTSQSTAIFTGKLLSNIEYLQKGN